MKISLSSTKNIVVIDASIDGIDDGNYDDAKDICKSICGNLYFPSSQQENNEIEEIFDSIETYNTLNDYIWMRLIYNGTENNWLDADNKGMGWEF